MQFYVIITKIEKIINILKKIMLCNFVYYDLIEEILY